MLSLYDSAPSTLATGLVRLELPKPTALRSERPVLVTAWIAAGLLLAAGVGPWLSDTLGIALPAFALICTDRPLPARDTAHIRRPEW